MLNRLLVLVMALLIAALIVVMFAPELVFAQGYGVNAPQSTALDLQPIATDLLEALGALVLSLLTWLVHRFAAKIGVDKNAAAMHGLDEALARAVNAGVGEAQQVIVAKGWTHVDTKNAIVAGAVQAALDHAQAALNQAGYDPSTPQGKAAIEQLVTRALPSSAPQLFVSPSPPTAPGV